jgi:hypothetical protein
MFQIQFHDASMPDGEAQSTTLTLERALPRRFGSQPEQGRRTEETSLLQKPKAIAIGTGSELSNSGSCKTNR